MIDNVKSIFNSGICFTWSHIHPTHTYLHANECVYQLTGI